MTDRAHLFRNLGASCLLTLGGLILVLTLLGLIPESDVGIKYQKVDELLPGFPGYSEVRSHFPIQKVDRVGITYPDGRQIILNVAHYQDLANHFRQALIFLPAKLTEKQPDTSTLYLNQLRWQGWLDASESFRHSAPDNTLFITWWDNAQRIHLLSAKKSWANAPVRDAFDRRQQDFWEHVSGGFLQQSAPLKQVSNWFLMDAENALKLIEKTIDIPNEQYFLASIDDLARLSEMRALSNMPVPFETRLFRSDENIHRLISRVKRWAKEKGNGSYLVQHLPSSWIRVWRITTTQGEKTLLARLLPFTSSLANPIQNLELIHRSEWSGFISIYRRSK